MSNAKAKSLIAFLIGALIASGTAASYFMLPGTVFAVILVVGILGTPAAISYGSMFISEAKTTAKLERGEGILARWTVDTATWEAFKVASKARDKETGWAARKLGFRGDTPPSGIEVVFLEDSVFVGGKIEWIVLEKHPYATLGSNWLEIETEGYENYEKSILRVPVPPNAHADAQRIADHFNAIPASR
jgi:hypothetical protein